METKIRKNDKRLEHINTKGFHGVGALFLAIRGAMPIATGFSFSKCYDVVRGGAVRSSFELLLPAVRLAVHRTKPPGISRLTIGLNPTRAVRTLQLSALSPLPADGTSSIKTCIATSSYRCAQHASDLTYSWMLQASTVNWARKRAGVGIYEAVSSELGN